MIAMWGGQVAPIGWLECNGQSTAAYPLLGQIVGAAVPDLRGEFIRGWDHGRGVDASRTFGSAQGDLAKPVSHTHNVPFASSYTHPAWASGSSAYGSLQPTEAQCNSSVTYPDGGIEYGTSYFNFNIATSGPSTASGAETRPRNIALMYIIKHD
jgi:microcystin-dependent protein